MKGLKVLWTLLLLCAVRPQPPRLLPDTPSSLVPLQILPGFRAEDLEKIFADGFSSYFVPKNQDGKKKLYMFTPSPDPRIPNKFWRLIPQGVAEVHLTIYKHEKQTPDTEGIICFELALKFASIDEVHYQCLEAKEAEENQPKIKKQDDVKDSKGQPITEPTPPFVLTLEGISEGEFETLSQSIKQKVQSILSELWESTRSFSNVGTGVYEVWDASWDIEAIIYKFFGRSGIVRKIGAMWSLPVQMAASSLRDLWDFSVVVDLVDEATILATFDSGSFHLELSIDRFDPQIIEARKITPGSNEPGKDGSIDSRDQETPKRKKFREIYGAAIEQFLEQIAGPKDSKNRKLNALTDPSALGGQRREPRVGYISRLLPNPSLTTDDSMPELDQAFSPKSFFVPSPPLGHTPRNLIIGEWDQRSQLNVVNFPVFLRMVTEIMATKVQTYTLYSEKPEERTGSFVVDVEKLLKTRRDPFEENGSPLSSAENLSAGFYFATPFDEGTPDAELDLGSFFGVIEKSALGIKAADYCAPTQLPSTGSVQIDPLLIKDWKSCGEAAGNIALILAVKAYTQTLPDELGKTPSFKNQMDLAFLFPDLYRLVFVRVWEYKKGIFQGFHLKLITQFFTAEYLIPTGSYVEVEEAVQELLQANLDHLQGSIIDSRRASKIRLDLKTLETLTEDVIENIKLVLFEKTKGSGQVPKLLVCREVREDAVVFRTLEVGGDPTVTMVPICQDTDPKGAKVIEIIPSTDGGYPGFEVRTFSPSDQNKIGRSVPTVYKIRERYGYDFTSTFINYITTVIVNYVLESRGEDSKLLVDNLKDLFKQELTASSRAEARKRIHKEDKSTQAIENAIDEDPEKGNEEKLKKYEKNENFKEEDKTQENQKQGETILNLPEGDNDLNSNIEQKTTLSEEELKNKVETNSKEFINTDENLAETSERKEDESNELNLEELGNLSGENSLETKPKTENLESNDGSQVRTNDEKELEKSQIVSDKEVVNADENRTTKKNVETEVDKTGGQTQRKSLRARGLREVQQSALDYWRGNRSLWEEGSGFLGDLELSDSLSNRLGLPTSRLWI